jgi:YVTN family beta-propeller protein
VALHTAGAVAVVDLKAGKVLKEIAVGKGPYDLALTKDALHVTCEGDDTLVTVGLAGEKVRRRLAIGQAPRGIAVERETGRVFVACHDESALRWVQGEDDTVHSLPLTVRPDRMAGPPAPGLFIVGSEAGEHKQVIVGLGGKPAIAEREARLGLANVRGLTVAGSGAGIVAPAQRHRASVPATQVAQGWVFTNGMGLSLGRLQLTAFAVLDEPQRAFADPSDVAYSPEKHWLYVACAGVDTVLVVDTLRLLKHEDKRRKEAMKGEALWLYSPDRIPARDDLTASRHYVAARLPTQANPRRLAVSADGKTLVVSNYLGDSLTVIDAVNHKVIRHIPLGGSEPDAARRGEILFNSAKMTFQSQFSCASCHPGGGADGLNWDLPRDGVGNFMNTRSLLGVKDTAPYGWHGSSPTLADRVRGTLRTVHQHEPGEAELADLVAYLETLPPPRPLPLKVEEKKAAARGRLLFEGKALCVKCHPGSTLQDGRTHDIGSRVGGDVQDRFDTPSLRGVARTAPYLHHGQAATLDEVFAKYNASERHGAAHRLGREELGDLIAYLKSL